MKFKIVSSIVSVYALIGLFVSLDNGLEKGFVITLVYALVLAFSSYGLWHRKQLAIVVLLAFFLVQSVRWVSSDSLIPHIAPISISIPFGDFSVGKGYLIDVFAILMVVVLGWLFDVNRKPHQSNM